MDKNNALFLSFIFSKLDEDYTMDADDIKYELNPEVTNVQAPIYIELIRMLGEGASYEDLFNYIDNYRSIEYDDLLEDHKAYIKTRIRKDINSRMKKIKGEDNNE